METYLDWMRSCYFISVTGQPAVSVPCGFTADSMPFGLQLVGPMHGDCFTLGVAAALEQLFSCDLDLARPVPDLSRLTDGTHQGAGS